MSDPILPSGEAGLREARPEVLVSALSDDAEQLAVALTEAVLADGLGFKGPFEEFGRIAEPLLLDALGAARRDGAQIALAQIQSDRTRLEAENERLRAALQPFAKTGELFPPRDPEAWDQCVYLPAAGREYALAGDHLRAARAALAQLQPEERK